VKDGRRDLGGLICFDMPEAVPGMAALQDGVREARGLERWRFWMHYEHTHTQGFGIQLV